jgi:hypothetical protein
MASTYSTNLKIELIGTGEQAGTWGNTTNTNLGTALEQAVVGKADVTMSSTTVTLTLSNSNAAQNARAIYLNLTGSPGGAAVLEVPAIEKPYIVKNGSDQQVTIKPTAVQALLLLALALQHSWHTIFCKLATAVTDETGTGALVFATSPTLVTPLLGTPTSGNLSNCTVDGTDAVGFRNIPQNSQSADYTLVLADSGKHIFHPVGDNNARTFTIPANSSVAYPVSVQPSRSSTWQWQTSRLQSRQTQ